MNRSPASVLLLVSTALVLSCCSDAEKRKLAGGYQLKRVANEVNRLALAAPNEDGGLIIDEIGWRKPFIIARSTGSMDWDVINTERAQHVWISETQRKTTADYQDIPVQPAATAWNRLNTSKPLW
jgi:hypothetical protein